MSTGTLIRARSLVKEQPSDKTVDCTPKETTSTEEQMREQMLESAFGPELFFRTRNTHFADSAYFDSMFRRYMSGTSFGDWGTTRQDEIAGTESNVWDRPKFRKLVAEPLGAPVELTAEEADEIVRLAFGRRPDLPTGKDWTKEVRELLGHSMIERLKKTE
jgi:hypothetical protein